MDVARRTGAAILSVDSMQVYRGMDIGTAKPTPAERLEVPHGMIDVAEPSRDYTVAEFQAEARRFIHSADRPVMIVGGSGLHFRSVVDPLIFPDHDPAVRAELETLDHVRLVDRLLALDPAAGETVDLQNPRRVVRALEIALVTGETPTERSSSDEHAAVQAYRPLIPFVGIGVDPGEGIEDRIRHRTRRMIDAGLVDEVSRLAGSLGRNAAQAVGYKEILPVVRGEASVESAIGAIDRATLALAKRQRTFFRRDPRLQWLAPETSIEEAVTYCLEVWRRE